MLNGQSLEPVREIVPKLKLNDIKLSNISLTSNLEDPFKKATIESILQIEDNYTFIGYSNGFIQEISLTDNSNQKVFTCIELKINKSLEKDQEEEEKAFLVEKYPVPAVLKINYNKGVLIGNHCKSYVNSEGDLITTKECLIIVYNEGKIKKLNGCLNHVFQSDFMPQRQFYIALSYNILYIWEYFSGDLVLKIPFNEVKIPKFENLLIYSFAVFEFGKKNKETLSEKEKEINGDFIFLPFQNNLIISKISYENKKGEILWIPENVLELKTEIKDSKKEINWNKINFIEYYFKNDQLVFFDINKFKIFDGFVKNIIFKGEN